MKFETGKTQSYSRVCNNLLVIKHLQYKELSGTELSERLSLSNATLSSILKQLLSLGIIKVSESQKSDKELGRKRVHYTLNDNFGLFLNVNISNHQAHLSLANLKEQILDKEVVDIEQYDAQAIYKIVLIATQLLLRNEIKLIPLKCVVISLPGRVNQETGELLLSKQFDPNLFKEQDFIKNAFKNQFPGVPILISNDVNIATQGEMRKGSLVGAENAIYISIDQGIGGSLVINGKLFGGDYGYSGEFGLLKINYRGESGYLDDFVSLRVLRDEAEKITGEKVGRTRLIELYNENQKIHEIVVKSGHFLGNGLKTIIEMLDINKIVLGGRCILFGYEYLDAIKSELENLSSPVDVTFSFINGDSKLIGATAMGVEYIISKEISGE